MENQLTQEQLQLLTIKSELIKIAAKHSFDFAAIISQTQELYKLLGI